MPAKAFSLSSFEDILRASETAYGLSKGDEREKILEALIERITSNGQHNFKDPMKELKPVSWVLYSMAPNLIHLAPENSQLV